MRPELLHGDCLEVLGTLDANSIDACVTDPPYGLGFMGKHWDRGVPDADVWREVYRVLKPGAHLLSFFGTRTYHRGAVAIEDAGFEIRDQIGWLYGSGFPKSLDISKAIDKAAGALTHEGSGFLDSSTGRMTLRPSIKPSDYVKPPPATEAAKQWSGWGTALKPAWEPIVVARKPLDGTVTNNVLTHGVGGLNIDGCRVETADDLNGGGYDPNGTSAKDLGMATSYATKPMRRQFVQPSGRFPANVIHDGSDEVLAEFAKYGESRSPTGLITKGGDHFSIGSDKRTRGTKFQGHGDSGTAARFFYTAKASKDDRNDGLWDFDHTAAHEMTDRKAGTAGLNSPRAGAGRTSGAKNHHPTVKPVALMRYLVRLVTPKGGLVLDPFAGSGTTLIAAYREDRRAIGIELSEDYHRMASHRIDRATAQLRLGFYTEEAAANG